MKIFKPIENNEAKGVAMEKTRQEKNTIKKQKKEKPVKKELTATEIKEKLAMRTELSNTAKSKSLKNTQKLGEGFLNESFKPQIIEKDQSVEVDDIGPKEKDHVLKTDVTKNDPTDVITTEKLKSVIEKGAFNFNPKERDVLSRILNKEN